MGIGVGVDNGGERQGPDDEAQLRRPPALDRKLLHATGRRLRWQHEEAIHESRVVARSQTPKQVGQTAAGGFRQARSQVRVGGSGEMGPAMGRCPSRDDG
jgi:hypothetical protein